MADNQINLTKATLDTLPYPAKGKRDTYHDIKTNGLQLRITSTGVKTFNLYRRVKGGSPERVTLGRYPDMSVEQARRESACLNALLVQGINPNNDVRALKTETTLQELFDDFIKHRRNKRGAYLSKKQNVVINTISTYIWANGLTVNYPSSKIPTLASFLLKSAKDTRPQPTALLRWFQACLVLLPNENCLKVTIRRWGSRNSPKLNGIGSCNPMNFRRSLKLCPKSRTRPCGITSCFHY